MTEKAEPTDAPTPPEGEAPTPADEALVDDHVGAISAARHFLDLYAYMRQTRDTGQFDATAEYPTDDELNYLVRLSGASSR
ncbi:hypothetical protein [Pseudactinotalea sp.]|uniref:hypothetical protein n=1 Tax=Pseudactinotalea sp. TaxID=1926260 RepID=UPI003B3AB28B